MTTPTNIERNVADAKKLIKEVINSGRLELSDRNLALECPATIVPGRMRQIGMRGGIYGTREEA